MDDRKGRGMEIPKDELVVGRETLAG